MSSHFKNLPVRNPRPNIDLFMDSILHGVELARPPLVEYLIDPKVMSPILTEMLGRESSNTAEGYWSTTIS